MRSILDKTVIGVHAGTHHFATRAGRAARFARGRLLGGVPPTPTDLNVGAIRAAAAKLGVRVEPLRGGFLKLSHGKQVSYTARWSDFAFEPLVPAFVCGDKHLTSRILTERGLPVPPCRSFRLSEYETAVAFFDRLEKPVVTKPTRGTAGGVGVTVNIDTRSIFRSAFARARAWSDEVLVEAHIAGDHLRITILDQEILGVVMRIPAHVVGDGESSVRTLIAAKNAVWREGRSENRLFRPIHVDRDLQRVLGRSNLSLDSVPDRGASVYLREVSNADQGGEVHDVASVLHPDHARLALEAAAALGPTLCGVDLVVRDLSGPAAPGAVFINEVNTTPGLTGANELVDGRPSTYVAERVLRRLFAL